MSVIGPERLTVTADRKGKPIQLGGFDEADYYASRACVMVEYVRADIHRGAVEALRWALGFIEYQGEPSPLEDPREGEADAESYRRAQAFAGGQ